MKDNPFSYTNIMKGDPGKLFKGHAFNLVQTILNDQQLLTLSQNYFNSQLVISTYNCDTRQTNIAYNYYPFVNQTPKWYQSYNDEVFKLGLPVTQKYRLNEYETLHLSHHYVRLVKELNFNNLAFRGHKEHIDEFAELRYNWKILRDAIKHIDYNQIMDCDIEDGVLILPHKLRNTVY